MKTYFYPLCFLLNFYLCSTELFAQMPSISNQYKEAAIVARCLSEITNCPERKAWMIKLAEWNECQAKTLITGSDISPEACERLKPLTMNPPNCPDDANFTTEEVNQYLTDCKNGKSSSLPGHSAGNSDYKAHTNSPNSYDQKHYNSGNTDVGRAIIDKYNLAPEQQNELNKLKEEDQAMLGGAMVIGEGIGKLIEKRREKKRVIQERKIENLIADENQRSANKQDSRLSEKNGSTSNYNDHANLSVESSEHNNRQRRANDISYVFSAGIGGLASPVITSNITEKLLNNPLNYYFSIGTLRKRGLSWSLDISGVNQLNNEFAINAEAVNGNYYDYTGKLSLKANDYQLGLGKDFNGTFDNIHLFVGVSAGVLAISKHYWEYGPDLDHYIESSLKDMVPHGSGNLRATIFLWKNLCINAGISYNILLREVSTSEVQWYKAKSFANWSAGITYRFARKNS